MGVQYNVYFSRVKSMDFGSMYSKNVFEKHSAGVFHPAIIENPLLVLCGYLYPPAWQDFIELLVGHTA